MNDIFSTVLSDPFFLNSFDLIENTGSLDADGLWSSTETQVTLDGHIQQVDGDLDNLPEGVNAKDVIAIYTKQALVVGNTSLERYTVEYKGKQYTVFNVEDWSEYGYYKALATLKTTIGAGVIPPLLPSVPYTPPWTITEVTIDNAGTNDQYRIRSAWATIVTSTATFARTVKAITGIAQVYDTDQVTLLAEITNVTLLPNGQVDIVDTSYNGKLLYLNYFY